jgi:hypothetical protein
MIIKQAESKPIFAAGLERIVARDPFDQQLVAAFSPVLTPLLTYIGRTPALSNALVALAGQNTPLVTASWVKRLKIGLLQADNSICQEPVNLHAHHTVLPSADQDRPW